VVGTTDSLILSPNDLSDTLLDLSDLTDQRSALESLSERDDSSNSFLDDDFEIPNSQDLEIPGSVPLPQHSCHNFELSENWIMESDYIDSCSDPNDGNDPSSTNIKQDDPGTQDSILQMLHLISNQMVATTRDLQDRFAATESKFTQELQRITQENETF